MTDGEQFSVLQRDDEQPVEVTVRFSDGHTLTTPASVLGPSSDRPDRPPTRPIIRRDDITLAELENVLRDSVESFGTAPAEVDLVIQGARSAEGGEINFKRSVLADIEPPESLDIQSTVTALDGRVSVNYTVSWEPS